MIFESSTQTILNPQDVSADGRFLLYVNPGEKTGLDLWVLTLTGGRKPFPYLTSPENESAAQFSPDGHWVAYVSNELGPEEVFIQSFPTASSKRQISTASGGQPRWRADGRELYYLALDEKLMAVPIAGGEKLEAGAPQGLFQTRIAVTAPVAGAPDSRQQYDVTADGKKFILLNSPEQAGPTITVVVNWTAGLKKQ